MESSTIKRIKLHIDGLDENIQGGVPEGHIVLISGAAGTMKSSLAFNTLYNEALNNKSGLYLSLEQSVDSITKHVLNMGYNLDMINYIVIKDLGELHSKLAAVKDSDKGNLVVVDIGAIRKEIKQVNLDENRSWLNVIKNVIKKMNAEIGCPLFVLDSLSALYVLSRFQNPRIELFFIYEFLRDLKITSLLISEMPLDGSKYSEYEIEDFLADAIVVIKLTMYRRQVVREINVVKMRATDCNNDIFSLQFKNGKFQALYGGQNPLL